MLPCILQCIPPFRQILKLLEGLAALFVFLITLVLSPLWLLFYLLCWTRAKITQLMYRADDMELLEGGDAFYGQEIMSTNSLINVACFMEGNVSIQVVKEVMLNRIVLQKDDKDRLLFPKFSRYVTLKGGYLLWQNEEKFTIDNHILEYKGKLPNTEAGLLKIINKISNQMLPAEKSGWQIILIPSEGTFDIPASKRYFIRFPQSCMLCRVHHSIADGLSLTRLIVEQLTEDDPAIKDTIKKMVVKRNLSPGCWLASKAIAFCKLVHAVVFAPFVQLKQALINEKNLVHGPKLSNKKLINWTPAISLQMVKDIKNAAGTTVNDVVMACLAGALRRFFIARKAKIPAFIHGAIPVSLQSPQDLLSLKNSLTFVIANLPTGEMDPLQRLKMTKYVMDSLKQAPDVLVNKWLLKYFVNVLPDSLIRWFVSCSPVSIIFSNVPGPCRKRHFKGHKITSIIPFLPHRSTTGVAVCIFSYSGDIRISVSVDTAIINKMDDVKEFLAGFLEEFKDLQSILKLGN